MKRYRSAGFTVTAVIIVVLAVAIMGGAGVAVAQHARQQPSAARLMPARVDPGAADPAPSSQPVASLTIKQWSIQIPLSASISDAYYTMQADGSIILSSSGLDSALKAMTGCHPGIGPLTYERAKPGDTVDGFVMTEATLRSSGAKLGDYYYYQPPMVQPMCISQATAASIQAARLHAALQTAFRAAVAE